DPVGTERRQGGLREAERTGQVGAPDVAAINQAKRKHLVADGAEHRAQLFRRADEIDVKTLHRESAGEVEIVAEGAEIGREQDFWSFARKCRISVAKRLGLAC